MPVQVICKFHKVSIKTKQAILRIRSNNTKASNTKVNSPIWSGLVWFCIVYVSQYLLNTLTVTKKRDITVKSTLDKTYITT